ncbi:MAG: hypothetical protein MUF69_04550, partial [Desulfobacterota bacterium]|nr:hypothetical protein [Thermodesulfobacteriota bacterium]
PADASARSARAPRPQQSLFPPGRDRMITVRIRFILTPGEGFSTFKERILHVSISAPSAFFHHLDLKE